MSVIEAERPGEVDRRRWPRAAVRLPVRVIDTEESFRVLVGTTLDVGVGGTRAILDGPLLGAFETTVQLELGDRMPLVCEARVADGGPVAEGWEYRLVFCNLDADEIMTLATLATGMG